ncbi:MAG: peptidase [Hydrogenophilales bacterium 28-61-23]|nr:MAG: peptidase [Hydrogenophilales bacterium 28-61-23]
MAAIEHQPRRAIGRGKLTPIVATALLLALASAGYGAWHFNHATDGRDIGANLAGGASRIDRPAPVVLPGGLPNFIGIVQAYGPAVVNIQVAGLARADASNADARDDPLFRLFPRFGISVPQEPMPARGEGSGFIIGSDGVILTNAHVVDGAREVIVKLTDRREFKARVIGVDRLADVAVLRIKADGLPTVHLGKAEPVRVGEWVLAIGSPFGFENSASAGIVSGKARALPDEGYVPFIQTDVAVNPGNSGGPLFNQRGEVVGINSQIYSRTGGYQGLSFAIPIDVAVQVMEQILHEGKVTRGRLGVTIQEMNMNLAQSFHLSKPAGALISAVEPGSPAQHAGLKAGDVILAAAGQAIAASSELPPLIAAMKPGTTADLKIWRDKEELKVSVRVGELAQETRVALDKQPDTGHLGLALRPLSPEERQQAGVDDGLLVLGITGPAARAGIQDGDIILALNGVPLHSVEALRAQAAKAGKHIALLLQRGEAKLFVPLNLGEGG